MATDKNKVSLDDMRDILGIASKPDVEVAKATMNEDGSFTVYESSIAALGEQVTEHAKRNLQPALTEAIAKITAEDVGKLGKELKTKQDKTHADLIKLAESVRVVELVTPKATKKLKGVQHAKFDALLHAVNCNLPVLMVGPAGTGKTHGAGLVAEAMGLEFHSISVGSQTSKSDLIGYLTATGTYVRTQFREAYENGGMFLLDEADAGNSNVLILLNAALSNGYMAFPDGMIHVHPDFRLIATANTFGHGANRQYVGRNQLDAATLDRFVVIVWDIDDRVEENMAGTGKDAKRWLATVRAVRKQALEVLELRVVVSPRATMRGSILLENGMKFDDVLEMALLGNMPASEKKELDTLARAAWDKAGA